MRLALNRGHLVAILLVLGTLGWMLSGDTDQPTRSDTDSLRPTTANSLPRVQASHLQPQPHQQQIRLSGQLAEGRQVTLQAEIKAKVVAIQARKGQQVKAGELLLQLDKRDWPARVKQAEANLKQRQLEQQSARRLSEQGLANQSLLAQAETALANAEAELTSARLQLAATDIRAPFDGIVNNRMVETGDYVREGGQLLQLVDVSPYKAVAGLPENQLNQVQSGIHARVKPVSGPAVAGQISFVAVLANQATRTFRLEVEIANPDNQPVALGQSAEIIIPLTTRPAYRVSPALLIVDDSGQLGLKTLDQQQRVQFTAVELEGAEQDGVWVFGPEQLDLITQGAGFVNVGDQVEAVWQTTSSATPEN
ncbi:efflux RND transporter periplasmic adaptor subunit [Oceanobacter mangrovi]|uniref:efflux RND transporter periplasmic adaptor subunit n=1 Tax=Oceanobacter mangrovi TaxID=2862510 RepID=UPI001C8E660D|nr:efflux RND transporter periplasmic adaptor subunit [Oceanobacter mangrovi]